MYFPLQFQTKDLTGVGQRVLGALGNWMRTTTREVASLTPELVKSHSLWILALCFSCCNEKNLKWGGGFCH